MGDELNNGALRMAVAQICQSMGWDALNKSTHDLLTDVLQKYMEEIAKCAHDYSQLYCHTEPSLDDLGLAFKHTGVILHELEDFVTQVDQVPFSYQLPQYPLPKPSLLQHPHKEDIIDRAEFYHEHLPSLVKALQQNEDEREGGKEEPQGIEDPSSQAFLRNEIKTIAKETETESIENTPNKRALTISSPELETDMKRRRLEGPFAKHSKEKKLDILQVLQEKNNSNSLSLSPSPDFIPMETENSEKSKFSFSTTSTPVPAIPPTSLFTPKKGVAKKDKPSKDKKLLSPPSSQTLDQKQLKLDVSPITEKQSGKSKSKPASSPASKSKKISTPTKLSSSPVTDKALLKTFPKPKTPKKSKIKEEKQTEPQVSKEPIISKLTFSPPASDKWRDEDSKLKANPMPKLIIKPMKIEKNIHSEYSVSSAPFDDSSGLEKKKSKTKITPSTSSTMDEAKPKKKKKKKDMDILGSPKTEPMHVPSIDIKPLVISAHVLNEPVPTMEKGGEIIKKKKKKHKEKDREKSKEKDREKSKEKDREKGKEKDREKSKEKDRDKSKEKDRDKSKPKKVKEPGSESSIPTIPTIKLKLENTPTTTISSQDIPSTTKISTSSSEPPVVKTKSRTVITETLSTTVQIYYCPACRLPDDGSFMIGCDTCDSWYHGSCVGIANDPGGNWYCEVCLAKKVKKKKKKKKAKANQS